MKATVDLLRFLNTLRRPSKAANVRGMRRRGEDPASFRIRRVTLADVPALAALHVATFNATHGLPLGRRPTAALRERQWSEKLSDSNNQSFCFVVTDPADRFVGFASGGPTDYPGFGARLDKIYLLRPYQRLGYGRRLIGEVSREYLARGVHSMMVFSEPTNPSCWFFERLGGERLFSETGEFHGAYGWRDLHALAAGCIQPEG